MARHLNVGVAKVGGSPKKVEITSIAGIADRDTVYLDGPGHNFLAIKINGKGDIVRQPVGMLDNIPEGNYGLFIVVP